MDEAVLADLPCPAHHLTPQHCADVRTTHLARYRLARGVSPNAVTTFGFLVTMSAGVAFRQR